MSVLNPKSLSPSHVLYYYVCMVEHGAQFLGKQGEQCSDKGCEGGIERGLLEKLKGKQNLKCKYNHFH